MAAAGPRRHALNMALERLEISDVLTVFKLDRLGRNTRHVPDVVENIREQRELVSVH